MDGILNGLMDYVWAFVIGGGFCLIGQILMDATTLTAPRVLVIFVVSGVVLQAVGLYEPLVNPLTWPTSPQSWAARRWTSPTATVRRKWTWSTRPSSRS